MIKNFNITIRVQANGDDGEISIKTRNFDIDALLQKDSLIDFSEFENVVRNMVSEVIESYYDRNG